MTFRWTFASLILAESGGRPRGGTRHFRPRCSSWSSCADATSPSVVQAEEEVETGNPPELSGRRRDRGRAHLEEGLRLSLQDEPTFALTADASEAHRQIPIHPCDWHCLGCQVQAGGDVYINTVGTFGVAFASYYSLVAGVGCAGTTHTVP